MSDRGRRPGMGRGRRSPLPPYGDRTGRDKGRDFHGFDSRDGRDRSPMRGDSFRDGMRKDDRPYPRRDDRFRDDGLFPPGGGSGATGNFEDPFVSGRKRFDGSDPYFDKSRFDDPFGQRPDQFVDSYKDPYRDMMDPRRPNDCEIIVVNKQQRSYAEAVERRLKNIGMMVDLLFLKDEVLLTQTIDDISRRGSLYAVVVTQQHEAHGSVTLNILHGTPQEHRNMPLDDALRLVARNFHEYVQSQREKVRDPATAATEGPLPPAPQQQAQKPYAAVPSPLDREVQYLLNLLADGKYLSVSELDRVIRYLQERRERMAGTGTAAAAMPTNEGATAAKSLQPLTATSAPPGGAELPLPVTPKSLPDDDRTKLQQPPPPQDIQQRILNIINQPPGSPGPVVAQPAGGYGLQHQQPPSQQQELPSQQPPSSTFLNFDNPNVKKALDSLIQSGPNLLKSIGMGSQLDTVSQSGTGGGGGYGTTMPSSSSSSSSMTMGGPSQHPAPPPVLGNSHSSSTSSSSGMMMSGYGLGLGGGYASQQGGGATRHQSMMSGGSQGGMTGRGMMGGPRRY